MARAPQRYFIIIDDDVIFGCASLDRLDQELDRYIENHYKISRCWNNSYYMKFYEMEKVDNE